eukprot:CAMPEP_0185173624 /NCGR_PEP_ID=MMETSP1139-20130426/23773_1 /TAXON_ID=298111 /ORGANISM="Pavlova sp., Strain CCMP459" /LENGTH=147 /DNA_ID=CAMNT_0027739321 /DNA_START=126 /DNA_END=569 /DNA_ORIENTATION=-
MTRPRHHAGADVQLVLRCAQLDEGALVLLDEPLVLLLERLVLPAHRIKLVVEPPGPQRVELALLTFAQPVHLDFQLDDTLNLGLQALHDDPVLPLRRAQAPQEVIHTLAREAPAAGLRTHAAGGRPLAIAQGTVVLHGGRGHEELGE